MLPVSYIYMLQSLFRFVTVASLVQVSENVQRWYIVHATNIVVGEFVFWTWTRKRFVSCGFIAAGRDLAHLTDVYSVD